MTAFIINRFYGVEIFEYNHGILIPLSIISDLVVYGTFVYFMCRKRSRRRNDN